MKSIYTHVEEPLDTKLYVPYLKPNDRLQAVVDCLRIQRIEPVLVKVDDGDAYWRLLRDAWAEGEEFFVVEHDVLVWAGAISQMSECSARWCSLPTMCHGRYISTTFGCVKFGRDLVERNPAFFDDIPTTWFHLDANFADKLGWPFIKPDVHVPVATHLNEVQWSDEISTRYTLERKVVWQSQEVGGEPVAAVNFRVAEDRRRRFRRDKGERVSRAHVDSHG